MTISRRRFLTITAAACALPLSTVATTHSWRGTALGARASITLAGGDATMLAGLTGDVEAEIARLESIFSLFKSDSALSRLNRAGRLITPPPEMLEVLSLADAVHTHTEGGFDPTVQRLWRLYAEAAALDRAPTAQERTEARNCTGWHHVHFSPAEITMRRPGVELTLNGIAQGYIADRIAGLLRSQGFTDVLIDMGEISALGHRSGLRAWHAGIASPSGEIVAEASLSDRALATSAPMGTVLDPNGKIGHLIDPRTGLPGGTFGLVSVSDRRAAIADALSTAFCLLKRPQIAKALENFPSARLEYIGPPVDT